MELWDENFGCCRLGCGGLQVELRSEVVLTTGPKGHILRVIGAMKGKYRLIAS